jgi:hypothetical protein
MRFKEALVHKHQYRPADLNKAIRKTRLLKGRFHQTYKKKGDKIIHADGRVEEVTKSGWY